MSIMKGTFLLVLLLKCFPQSDSCEYATGTLVCRAITTDFPPGASTLFLILQDIGEINSTVFHHDNLASITSVIFTKVQITKIAEGAFRSFLSLKSLNLGQNKLTNINDKWLSRPATLTELSMSENNIRVLRENMLDGFTNLTKLNLSRNKINYIQTHTFSHLGALSFLDLTDNNLTHLTSEMFGPLHTINMGLQGNPWECSCDNRDCIEFIMDLKNRSLLLHNEVTCASPSSLRGQLVWNVSVCSTSMSPGPSPITLTTSQDLNVSRPTADRKPTLNQSTMHSLDPLVGTHQPPPYTTNIVPMLITVIVVLCVVLLLVIILAVLYRRKHNRKIVAPMEQNKQVTIETGHEKTDVTGHRRWDIETLSPISLTGLRAKSANAILFTSQFGVSCDFHVDPALVQDGESKRGVEEETDGILAKVDKNDSVQSSVRNLQNEKNLQIVDCENVPYLSIGPNQCNNTTVDTKSPLAKVGRGMHRISTWPPTAVQWQERCKREKEQEGVDNIATAWTQAEFKVPSILDKTGNLPNEQKKTDVCQVDTRFDSEEENDTGPWINNAENEDYIEDDTQNENDLEETSSLGDAASSSPISDRNDLIFRNAFVNAQMMEKDHKLKAVTLQMEKASTDRSYSNGVGSKKGESRSGSNAPSDGGNEYVFVDLLHEVVQNRGRWTRDRWRQIHMNQQEQQGTGEKVMNY